MSMLLFLFMIVWGIPEWKRISVVFGGYFYFADICIVVAVADPIIRGCWLPINRNIFACVPNQDLDFQRLMSCSICVQ
jgi:hypothetical protein